MVLLWTALRLALALRGNLEASRAAWLYAVGMDGSTNLSPIGEMRKALLRRICSPLPNSSVVREPATMRRHYKCHSRPQPLDSYYERPLQTWATGLSDRLSGFPSYNNGT